MLNTVVSSHSEVLVFANTATRALYSTNHGSQAQPCLHTDTTATLAGREKRQIHPSPIKQVSPSGVK